LHFYTLTTNYPKKKLRTENGGTCLQSQLLGRQRQKDPKFKASLGKINRTQSQKQKDWRHSSSGRALELYLTASVRPWIQYPVLHTNKKIN
jgi:hypothetical protein